MNRLIIFVAAGLLVVGCQQQTFWQTEQGIETGLDPCEDYGKDSTYWNYTIDLSRWKELVHKIDYTRDVVLKLRRQMEGDNPPYRYNFDGTVTELRYVDFPGAGMKIGLKAAAMYGYCALGDKTLSKKIIIKTTTERIEASLSRTEFCDRRNTPLGDDILVCFDYDD